MLPSLPKTNPRVVPQGRADLDKDKPVLTKPPKLEDLLPFKLFLKRQKIVIEVRVPYFYKDE